MSKVFEVNPDGEASAVPAVEEKPAASDLTPRQIVEELDRYIVGQDAAKRAVAIALRNRTRRLRLPDDVREEIIPKNILMIGPTGVGKTEIARRLAALANAPFVKVEATKFTEVGYVGRDVDSMVRDLAQIAYRMVESEEVATVQAKAEEAALERVLDLLQPEPRQRRRHSVDRFAAAMGEWLSKQPADAEELHPPKEVLEADAESDLDYELRKEEQTKRVRAKLRKRLLAGEMDDRMVEVEVDDSSSPFMQVFSPQGLEEMGMDISGVLGGMMPKKKKTRQVKVSEAREILTGQIAREMVDQEKVTRDALARAEESGIIFVDELDKIAGRERGDGGPQVSREGVQRDILPIIEGATVVTKFGPVRTDHVLFIAAGAFHTSKPSDLIPELQGRLPIRVELESLGRDDLRRILTEPQNALTKQYAALMGTEGVTLEFTDDGIDALADIATDVNARTENIGARRLHTIMERLLEEISFQAPDIADKQVTIDAAYVRERLSGLAKDEDLSRYIL